MENETFTVTFFCKKAKTNTKGKAPIYVRITTSGCSTEIYTKCQIDPVAWNQNAERVTAKDSVSFQINEIIKSYRAKIYSIYDALIKENKRPDCMEIKARMSRPNEISRMFLYELSLYCDKRQSEVGVLITQLTANKYHRILRYLKEYTMASYNVEDLRLDQVNYSYLDGFNTFVQTAHNCKNNGSVNLLLCLKNFMSYCVNNEWIEDSPFRKYKLSYVKTEKKNYLTKEEMDIMIKKDFHTERLNRVRDVFIFCCLTGLSYTDVYHLRNEHLFKDSSGILWIKKPREKTSVLSNIMLVPEAIKLINKYEHDDETQAKKQLLPVPCNQRMNSYLKEILHLCDIDKNITSHCARKSFATNAFEYGMPIEIIAKVLGHNNVNMTRRYAEISDNNIKNEMLKFRKKMWSKSANC